MSADERFEELYDASRRGKQTEVLDFLKQGVAPDAFLAYDGSSALVMAAKNGHVPVIQVLLAHGADATIQTDDLSNLLHHAVKHEAALLALLDDSSAAKMVDEPNDDGFTALHIAAYYGSLGPLRVLLEKGKADVLLCTSEEGDLLQQLPEDCTAETRAYLESKVREAEVRGNGKEVIVGTKITEKYGYDCFDGS